VIVKPEPEYPTKFSKKGSAEKEGEDEIAIISED
jgi:hypothetical protein